MFRFTIRDVLWLTVVVALGMALGLSKRREVGQFRELATLRDELARVTNQYTTERRKSRNMVNALIRELEKDRGRIGQYSFRVAERQNPDKWDVKFELLDGPISDGPISDGPAAHQISQN
jgi:hypothetical protein